MRFKCCVRELLYKVSIPRHSRGLFNKRPTGAQNTSNVLKDVLTRTHAATFYCVFVTYSPVKRVCFIKCYLLRHPILFQLICYIFLNFLCILSNSINVVSSTPKTPISVFEFHVPHLLYIMILLFPYKYPIN